MKDWRVNGLVSAVVMTNGHVQSVSVRLNVMADSRVDAIREFLRTEFIEVKPGQFVVPRNCSLMSVMLEDVALKLEEKIDNEEKRKQREQKNKGNNGTELDDPLGR